MMNYHVWKLVTGKEEPELFLEMNAVHMDEVTLQLPAGAYTTFRTFEHNKALHLSGHVDRLEESTRLIEETLQIPRIELRKVIQWIIAHEKFVDSRIRIVVHVENKASHIFIIAEPLSIPADKEYQNGVETITINMHRDNPKAKLTSFIQSAGGIKQSLPENIHEALMVENNLILEGLSSNFFALIDSKLRTANEGVLRGITRKIVIEVAQEAGLSIAYEPVSMNEIGYIQECFITSSSRAVLPVRTIDDREIGAGRPGEITKMLLDRYNQRIAKEIRTI